jgi:hypothetical protein
MNDDHNLLLWKIALFGGVNVGGATRLQKSDTYEERPDTMTAVHCF